MIEYKDNETYETDKLKAIQILASTTDAGGKWLINLLKQSMWVGNGINSQHGHSSAVEKCDGCGRCECRVK